MEDRRSIFIDAAKLSGMLVFFLIVLISKLFHIGMGPDTSWVTIVMMFLYINLKLEVDSARDEFKLSKVALSAIVEFITKVREKAEETSDG